MKIYDEGDLGATLVEGKKMHSSINFPPHSMQRVNIKHKNKIKIKCFFNETAEERNCTI